MNRRSFAKKLFGCVAGLLALAGISQAGFNVGDTVRLKGMENLGKYTVQSVESQQYFLKRTKRTLENTSGGNWYWLTRNKTGSRSFVNIKDLVV